MSKYFDTKPGSLEEAVSAAQQAAIAISKKERGEKPKNEKDEGNAFTGALMAAKEKGEKTFTVGGKTYDVKTEEDKLDPVNPKAAAKKFKDRKDKDLDNDGDVDSSDKYLHKRRKAISKSMGESLMSVAESVKAMWDEAAKKTESQDMEQDKDGDGMDDDQKAKKTAKKTDSGKDMTPVETSPKMPKLKNEKNKV